MQLAAMLPVLLLLLFLLLLLLLLLLSLMAQLIALGLYRLPRSQAGKFQAV